MRNIATGAYVIDSHAHIQGTEFDKDREEVLQRARDVGLTAIILIGTDLESSTQAVALAEQHDLLYATVGIHPHEAATIQKDTYHVVRRIAATPKVVGYGEIGLDYYYDHSPRDVQRKAFREQIRLGRELGLPLVIHSREAASDTLTILKEDGASDVGGVFHCFSGDPAMAREAMAMGFSISFSGVITFKNARTLLDVVKVVPLEKIMVETDSPYLTPHPHRGTRNEPAFVRYVVGKIAELKGVSPEEVARITSLNTTALFRLHP